MPAEFPCFSIFEEFAPSGFPVRVKGGVPEKFACLSPVENTSRPGLHLVDPMRNVDTEHLPHEMTEQWTGWTDGMKHPGEI